MGGAAPIRPDRRIPGRTPTLRHDERVPVVASRDIDLLRRFEPVLRRRYWVLAAVAIGSTVLLLRGSGQEWATFLEAGDLLFGRHGALEFGPGGLHIFANYPYLQFGPLAILVVSALRVFGDEGSRYAAVAMMTMSGLLFVRVLERVSEDLHGTDDDEVVLLRRATVLLGGALVMRSWADLATHFVHIDDALAVGFSTMAMWALAHRRAELTGVAIGLAVASKPWALILLPVVLALDGRSRLRAGAWALGIIAVTWLPFVIADTRTITAGEPAIDVYPQSVLHLFGVEAGTFPSFVRPAQLGVGLLLGLLVVRRSGWPGVLLAGVVVRIALDPAIFSYYTSGLLIAALAWDLLHVRRATPVFTAGLFLALSIVAGILPDTGQGILRLLACTATVAALLRSQPTVSVAESHGSS